MSGAGAVIMNMIVIYLKFCVKLKLSSSVARGRASGYACRSAGECVYAGTLSAQGRRQAVQARTGYARVAEYYLLRTSRGVALMDARFFSDGRDKRLSRAI